MVWYFFTLLHRKRLTRSRINRTISKGYLKMTGKDRRVRHGLRVVGMKKTLVFHLGRSPSGERTDWVIHEYRLEDEELARSGILQWQAGSRQQTDPAGFEPDANNWGWNWLERWMTVRPWENRFLDMNLQDGVMVNGNEATEGKHGTKSLVKPSGRMPISTLHSNNSNQKTLPSHSEGSGSSSKPSAKMVVAPTLPSDKPKPKPSAEEVPGETISRPCSLVPRPNSTPKERNMQWDSQDKKRLSFPGNGAATAKRSINRISASKAADTQNHQRGSQIRSAGI